MKKALLLGIFVVSTFMFSCSKKNYTTPDATSDGVLYPVTSSKPRSYMPNATAFRMSGDYANNVAVTVSPDGVLTYFPAPSDITADSAPIDLGNGWWLNCQGIGPNSVFTKYTFAEYASLPQAPDPQQLLQAVIPGAKVTQFIELPMKTEEAARNIDEVKAYLKDR